MPLFELQIPPKTYNHLGRFRSNLLVDVQIPRVVAPGDTIAVKTNRDPLLTVQVTSVEGSDVKGAVTLGVKLAA